MVHADPADFDDITTFCTMRPFERAEAPERYRFPFEQMDERTRFGTPDDVKHVIADYAVEKLSLPRPEAEQFSVEHLRFYSYLFLKSPYSYNFMLFMAILRQIWEMQTVEALHAILEHFRDKRNLNRLVEAASTFGRQEDSGGEYLALLEELKYLAMLEESHDSVVVDVDDEEERNARMARSAAGISSLEKIVAKLKGSRELQEMCQFAGYDVRRIMNTMNAEASLRLPMVICADAAEFGIRHFDAAAAGQQIRMYPDNLTAQCNLEPIGTICLHCAVVAALNGDSGRHFNGFDPPCCVTPDSIVKLFSGPATPDYEEDKCTTCWHAKTVHYDAVALLGCRRCRACLKQSAELWELVDKVAQADLPTSTKYSSYAFGPHPPENVSWTEMPMLNRKMILAQSLGIVGSTLYSHFCEELFPAIQSVSPSQTTLTMDSMPNLVSGEVDDSPPSTIDAPVPRLFILLLETGYFAQVYDETRSKYQYLKKPGDASGVQQVVKFWQWLHFMEGYFKGQRTIMPKCVKRAESVSDVINVTSTFGTVNNTFILIRVGQTAIYSVSKQACTLFTSQLLRFVQFSAQTGTHHSALTPAVDLNLGTSDFSIVQGAEALDIVQFQKGKKLGEGKFGAVYEVTAGSLRLALKVIDVKEGPIEQQQEGVLTTAISFWIDLNDNKIYILMPRFTNTLAEYTESKKQHLASDGNDVKVAIYRAIAAFAILQVSMQVSDAHDQKTYHGDIHAKNVFVLFDEDDAILTVNLGDFGLAHFDETAQTETVTTGESCQNSSGTVVDDETTVERYDLRNVRSNVIRYMLEDIKKHLSVEERHLCDPGIGFTAEQMKNAASNAFDRVLFELALIDVFTSQTNIQVPENDLPLLVRSLLPMYKRELDEKLPTRMRTESTWDQVKACLQFAIRKRHDLDCLRKAVDEVLEAQSHNQHRLNRWHHLVLNLATILATVFGHWLQK